MTKFNKLVDAYSLYEKNQIIGNIKDTIEKLDEINGYLSTILPENLIDKCHAGSIDYDKNVLVIFTEQQQILFILQNLSQHILQGLIRYNFYFDAVLFRVTKFRLNRNSIIQKKVLTAKQQDQLKRLADLIGKPELIDE